MNDIRRRLLVAALASPMALRAEAVQSGISRRPIRFIVGQTPGATSDRIARALAPRLEAKWNQPFVVENRGGSGGAIALDAVAKSPPDGHVITIRANSTVTLPVFFKIDFDILASFTPICSVAEDLFVLAVHATVPARSYAEWLAWAKRTGSNANYGSPGNGTSHHLLMEALKLQTGLRLTHIPYKGSAPAIADLTGGQIATMFVPLGAALTLGATGKIALIGGSARERSPLARQIPSLHEQGLRDFDYTPWFSAWGPKGMAPDLVEKYGAAFGEVLAEEGVRDMLNKQGLSVKSSTPQELGERYREDYVRFAKLLGIQK